MFHVGQRGFVDVVTCNVPARRESVLVEGARSLGIGNNAIVMADHEAAEGLAKIDSIVAVACHTTVTVVVEKR